MKLAQWFLRRRFLNIFNIISLFCNYLPLEKGRILHLNKLKSPSPKEALCKIWLKLVQWFWRRKISSLFCNYLPLEKNPPSFEQTWFLFNQRCFVLSLVEIGTVVLEKIFKNFVSVYLLFRTYLPLEKDVCSFEQTWITFT